jgi:hypothetical protein
MVLWYRTCGALIGLVMPIDDWRTDRTGLCPSCATILDLANLKDEKPEGRKGAAPEAGNGPVPQKSVKPPNDKR